MVNSVDSEHPEEQVFEFRGSLSQLDLDVLQLLAPRDDLVHIIQGEMEAVVLGQLDELDLAVLVPDLRLEVQVLRDQTLDLGRDLEQLMLEAQFEEQDELLFERETGRELELEGVRGDLARLELLQQVHGSLLSEYSIIALSSDHSHSEVQVGSSES